MDSSTFSSSSWNGSGSERETISSSSTCSSTSPVGRFGLTASGARADNLAHGAEHELVADLVRDLRRLGRPLGVDHELREAALVAQVDEDEAAVVAPLRRPARQGKALPDVLRAELARQQIAPVHALEPLRQLGRRNLLVLLPERRTFELSGPHSTIACAPSRPAWVN